MTATPDVSVIVIGSSVRDELGPCFASIRASHDVSTEVIYVDNASTDDSVAWTRAQHPEVRVVELDENVFGVAREHGLRVATGRYVCFLDSDARLTPDALRSLAGALDEHPAWGLVGPRLVYDDGSLQLSCRRFPPLLLPILRRPPLDRFFEQGGTVRHHLMADDDHERPRGVLYVISACMLFRRSLVRAAGPFDERALAWGWEDADWCLRIWQAGGAVVYWPQATVVHSYRRLTARRPWSRDGLLQLKAHAYFQLKWARRRRALARLSERLDAEPALS
jgi:N-acetylglucosaminyl-diphospho-decaprenol L-rhamnosyltransferase